MEISPTIVCYIEYEIQNNCKVTVGNLHRILSWLAAYDIKFVEKAFSILSVAMQIDRASWLQIYVQSGCTSRHSASKPNVCNL